MKKKNENKKRVKKRKLYEKLAGRDVRSEKFLQDQIDSN